MWPVHFTEQGEPPVLTVKISGWGFGRTMARSHQTIFQKVSLHLTPQKRSHLALELMRSVKDFNGSLLEPGPVLSRTADSEGHMWRMLASARSSPLSGHKNSRGAQRIREWVSSHLDHHERIPPPAHTHSQRSASVPSTNSCRECERAFTHSWFCKKTIFLWRDTSISTLDRKILSRTSSFGRCRRNFQDQKSPHRQMMWKNFLDQFIAKLFQQFVRKLWFPFTLHYL